MIAIHAGLKGLVNVYTMDNRGTGHSTLLDCVAMQTNTNTSSPGNMAELSQVSACAQELEKKYGDLSSFSVTSAAMDVATFISDHTNDRDTIVFGLNYGTVLVERLIHLNPPKVTGYVLDGTATISGASRDKTPYSSLSDSDYGEVGDAFLALCATTSECNKRFVSKSLPATLRDLINHFDENPKSTCAALVSDLNRDRSSDPASYVLRQILAYLLLYAEARTLIPPVVYRLNRCDSNDVDVMSIFYKNLLQSAGGSNADSSLFYAMVHFSEMWEKPTPSISEMTSRFTDTLMSPAQASEDVPAYCAFSKEKSAVCRELDVGDYDGNGIIYEVDKYWYKSATIPPQASVLLLSGTLDPVMPHKYAENLLEVLKGEKKELITFEYASHSILQYTILKKGKETCGMKLLRSYVTNDGNLELLDKSCVDEMPAFSMALDDLFMLFLMRTYDAYDGKLAQSLLKDPSN